MNVRKYILEQLDAKTQTALSADQKDYLSRLEKVGWTTTRPTQQQIDSGKVYSYDLIKGTTAQGTAPTQEELAGIYSNPDKFYQNAQGQRYFGDLPGEGINNLVVYYVNVNQGTTVPFVRDNTSCLELLQKLYNFWSNPNSAESDQEIIQTRNQVQNCVFENKLIRGKITTGRSKGLIGTKKETMDVPEVLNIFYQILPNSADAKFRLNRKRSGKMESIEKKVKKTLKEISHKKKNKLVETKIVSSNLKMIIEDLNTFNSLPKSKRIKLGFKFLRETARIKKLYMLNEELGNLFQQIFGKSLDGVLTNVSEPLLNSIFDKIGITGDFKNKIMAGINAKSPELLSSMDNCENLTNFLSQEIAFSMANMVSTEQLGDLGLLSDSLVQTINSDSFKNNLAEKLGSQICELFQKFSENAKNLMTKLS